MCTLGIYKMLMEMSYYIIDNSKEKINIFFLLETSFKCIRMRTFMGDSRSQYIDDLLNKNWYDQ